MRKQYQKTCPKCGEKIIVKNKADFEKHICKSEKKQSFFNEDEDKSKRKKFDI